jgi:hypothetical protein
MLSKNLKIRIYKTIILPVVLFESRMLRIFGPKRAEVTGEWGKIT